MVALFFQFEVRVIWARVSVLLGTDEDVGRAIVATVAWGTACETLGHADEICRDAPCRSFCYSSGGSACRSGTEHATYSMKPWRRSVVGPLLADELQVTDFLSKIFSWL